jgi:hypothetical protein
MNVVTSLSDLRPSERVLVSTLNELQFGRLEFVRIADGEVVLDPRPTTIRAVKFGSEEPAKFHPPSDEFQLKRSVIKLIEFIRSISAGEIRSLEVRHGMPWAIEVEDRSSRMIPASKS